METSTLVSFLQIIRPQGYSFPDIDNLQDERWHNDIRVALERAGAESLERKRKPRNGAKDRSCTSEDRNESGSDKEASSLRLGAKSSGTDLDSSDTASDRSQGATNSDRDRDNASARDSEASERGQRQQNSSKTGQYRTSSARPNGQTDGRQSGKENIAIKQRDCRQSEEEGGGERNREREDAVDDDSGPFVVSNIQCIHAEVKVVKCFINDIPIDISANQIGGLYTNRFLELVDQLVGKHHLLKRSVLLIKAWAFYESRTLGSHAGLLASYALETLVVYILNLYHTKLHSPLDVLLKFFEVFSAFDWENFGVTIRGPFDLLGLPRVDAQPPVPQPSILLSDDFIASCVVPTVDRSSVVNKISPYFQRRFMNIVDPLNPNNNLGRSINRANYLRIKKAFQKGAREILILSGKAGLPCSEVGVEDCLDFFRSLRRRHPSLFASVTEFEETPTFNPSLYDVLSTDLEELARQLRKAEVALMALAQSYDYSRPRPQQAPLAMPMAPPRFAPVPAAPLSLAPPARGPLSASNPLPLYIGGTKGTLGGSVPPLFSLAEQPRRRPVSWRKSEKDKKKGKDGEGKPQQEKERPNIDSKAEFPPL